MSSKPKSQPKTGKLDRAVVEAAPGAQVDVVYRPVPHADSVGDEGERSVWRVRIDLLSEPQGSFGLDVNDEVVFGRGQDVPAVVDLSAFDGEKLGVSRRHMMLRPTDNKLFVLDVGSTNGTTRNGYPIGVNTPYSLTSGDVLTLGGLQMVVAIVARPKTETGMLRAKADLGDALAEMVKTITSQLELDEVLSHAVEAALTLTSASETAVWLVDEETGDLFLEAERGTDDEAIRRMRLPVADALAGQVIESGKALRVKREPGGAQVEFRTSALVESLVYVPIALGGITIGVLAAAHREAGHEFGERDQRVLETIADFAAIAVQNSRVYRATELALARRVEELAAVNELSSAVSASLDPKQVYSVLTEQVRKYWQIEGVSLWMVDEKTQTASIVSDSRGGKVKISRVTKQMVNRVAKLGEPMLLSDISRETGGSSMLETQEIRSELAVPIRLKERVLGVLDLQSPDLNRFSETDMLTLQTVADQLAIAIQNAHLYKQVQRHAKQLEHHVSLRTEDLNAANEHLQVLSRLKDEFVSNVSHELRSPITNLKLLTDLLRKATPKRRESLLDTMVRETRRLERIVNDLLRLSRMDQGQVALNPTQIGLNDLVHQFVMDRTPLAESRNLTLTHAAEGSMPPVVADYGLLGQTLSILLTNALNYTPPGGKIRVSTQTKLFEDQRWVGYSVRDTGPGIPPDELPRLFERFFRGQAGQESGTAGAGLGLSIVKEIVDLHGGRVEVASEGVPGKGTMFSVWLPVAGFQQARLLLVDDDGTMLEVMDEILTSSGYDVQAFASGEAALAALRGADPETRLPELFVTDVVMSGITGLQLLEAVRSDPEMVTIPFLFISASTTLSMEGQIAGLENVTFLRKPFDSETLQQTVAAALDTQPAEVDGA